MAAGVRSMLGAREPAPWSYPQVPLILSYKPGSPGLPLMERTLGILRQLRPECKPFWGKFPRKVPPQLGFSPFVSQKNSSYGDVSAPREPKVPARATIDHR